ncbi:Hg(II)-responsive transcriptional regulator [Denitromonas iodatirespirans]|uniref:Mercuric resistance operon regulatory protein n=1 Tax=Denitromonas iodatirespirans TaxID=2795389 RepID=A0A944H6L0_DENI1|nr:Hg(II)-responsive transcriptional regulator [Denitromonas iodatirespirans]MBT0960278.1 Hg(II)-responsive transcriptional regulator [Denitromonas iodatirespirans]
MDIATGNLTIGTLAKAADVTVETIRFYQLKGLLPKPDKPYGGIRRYAEMDVARVKFIKAAQRLGFSLEEVGQLLTLEDGTHCDEARVLAVHKLHEVRERLAVLRSIETALATLVNDCCAASGAVKCPMIAALRRHGE